MAKNSKDERVSGFIDIGWLLDGLRGQDMPWHIDYSALVNYFAGERKLIDIYGYMALYPVQCYPVKVRSQRAVLELMKKQGIETRVGEMQIRGGMYIDQGVDVMLSVDMLEMGMNDEYDTAILISRRPTLLHTVESVKKLDKRVENVFFQYTCDPSDVLSNSCHVFSPLNEKLINKFV